MERVHALDLYTWCSASEKKGQCFQRSEYYTAYDYKRGSGITTVHGLRGTLSNIFENGKVETKSADACNALYMRKSGNKIQVMAL